MHRSRGASINLACSMGMCIIDHQISIMFGLVHVTNESSIKVPSRNSFIFHEGLVSTSLSMSLPCSYGRLTSNSGCCTGCYLTGFAEGVVVFLWVVFRECHNFLKELMLTSLAAPQMTSISNSAHRFIA